MSCATVLGRENSICKSPGGDIFEAEWMKRENKEGNDWTKSVEVGGNLWLKEVIEVAQGHIPCKLGDLRFYPRSKLPKSMPLQSTLDGWDLTSKKLPSPHLSSKADICQKLVGCKGIGTRPWEADPIIITWPATENFKPATWEGSVCWALIRP